MNPIELATWAIPGYGVWIVIVIACAIFTALVVAIGDRL